MAVPRLRDEDLAVPQDDTVDWLIARSRLDKDMNAAAALLSGMEQRMLVDLYYSLQENRKRAFNQLRAGQSEPNEFVSLISGFLLRLEKIIVSGLDKATNKNDLGRWAKKQVGIGPVIAAGLAAYIDITTTPTVSCLWSLAGCNPNQVWSKGQKRPWNAKLKVLRWKASDSFKKLHNHPGCYYGKLYAARKQLEVERNEAGEFRTEAEKTLANVKIKAEETRAWYEQGKLPPGRLDLRAMRYAAKRFLSHYFEVAHHVHYGESKVLPYILIAPETRHSHYDPPPGWPLED